MIPNRGSFELLIKSLKSIQFLKLRNDTEIILVDNNSIPIKYELLPFVPDLILHHSEKGRSSTRNLGARHAKGTWIVFFDSDCELIPKSFEQMVQKIEAFGNSIFVFQGNIVNQSVVLIDTLDREKYVESIINSSGFESRHESEMNFVLPGLDSAFMTIRKDLFFAIDGFNETLSRFEDRDLGIRIFLKKYLIYRCIGACSFKSNQDSKLQILIKAAIDTWSRIQTLCFYGLIFKKLHHLRKLLSSRYRFSSSIGKNFSFEKPKNEIAILLKGKRLKLSLENSFYPFLSSSGDLCYFDFTSQDAKILIPNSSEIAVKLICQKDVTCLVGIESNLARMVIDQQLVHLG